MIERSRTAVSYAGLLILLALCSCSSDTSPGLSNTFERVDCVIQNAEDGADVFDPPKTGWQPCKPKRMLRGFSPSVFWFRLQAPKFTDERLVVFEWKTLSYVDLIAQEKGRTILHQKAGDRRLRSSWPLTIGDYPAFPIKNVSGRTYFLRLQSDSILNFAITVRERDEFEERFNLESMVAFAYMGILLLIIVLSILLAITLRETVYLYYGMYVFFLWLNMNSNYGNAFRVLYPNSPWVASHIIFFALGSAFWSSVLFFRKATRLGDFMPRADRAARILQYIALFLIPFTLTDLSRGLISRTYTYLYLISILLFLVTLFRLIVKHKQKSLGTMAFAWGTYYLVVVFHLLFLLGIISAHPQAVLGPALMVPVEVILFGGGLIQSYRAILAEKGELAAENARIIARLESFSNRNDVRYAKTRLTGIDVDAALLALDRLMDEEQPYRNEEFTLADLGVRLKMSSHELSELLNSRLGLSFPQLLLNYRVREAERLMSQEQRKTMIEIAFEAGFNSKTAFNVGFKKLRGVSPSTYLSLNKNAERPR